MSLYSPAQITTDIGNANTTVYKLRQKNEEDALMRGDMALTKEPLIIGLLTYAVNYLSTNDYANPETHGLIAYLVHKTSGYSFGSTAPYYATPTTSQGSADITPARSGYQLFKQYVIGRDADTPGEIQVYTNTRLIGRYVIVVLDGTILPQSLADRQSYVYSISLGQIMFFQPLTAFQCLQIFTYIPTLSGWTKIVDTIATSVLNFYIDSRFIGKNVAVVIDGLILPIDLDYTASYAYSPLEGKISFTQPVAIGQAVQIYVY